MSLYPDLEREQAAMRERQRRKPHPGPKPRAKPRFPVPEGALERTRRRLIAKYFLDQGFYPTELVDILRDRGIDTTAEAIVRWRELGCPIT